MPRCIRLKTKRVSMRTIFSLSSVPRGDSVGTTSRTAGSPVAEPNLSTSLNLQAHQRSSHRQDHAKMLSQHSSETSEKRAKEQREPDTGTTTCSIIRPRDPAATRSRCQFLYGSVRRDLHPRTLSSQAYTAGLHTGLHDGFL